MAFIKWLCDRYQAQHYQDPTQRPTFLVAHVVTLFLINKTDTFYIPPALNNITIFLFFVLKS